MLNELSAVMHQNAVDHGFLDDKEDLKQFVTRAMMLINTETAELFEAMRNHQLTAPCDKSPKMLEPLTNEEEELADIVIRAFDYAGARGLDLGRAVAVKHAFNITRPYKHGGKAV